MAYQTKQQQAVLRCLQLRAEECLSAADLSEELRHGGLTVGLATVYRQLDKLTQQGLVHKVTTEEGALYQYCPQAGHPHDCFLLRCEGCGRMVHLDCRHLEEVCRHLSSEHHFRIDPRRTVLTGSGRTAVKCALTCGAALTLKKELLTLPAAESASRSCISCHFIILL